MTTTHVRLEMKGLDEIKAKMAALTGSQQRKYLRQGASAAAAIQIKAARDNLKSQGSDRGRRSDEWIDTKGKKRRGVFLGLAKSFVKVPSSKWKNAGEMRRKGIIGSRIGFRRSMGAHAHLVERGHDMVTAKGKSVGFVRPYPFMRPAADSNHSQFVNAWRVKISAGIAAIAKSRGSRL